MKSPQVLLKKVGVFLVGRCQELGYVPLITKIQPPEVVFSGNPSSEAVYVKLFGHYNYRINTVHAKFGVLDPMNLKTLGSLGEDNLCLTDMDKLLLITSLFSAKTNPLQQISKEVLTLEDIYNVWCAAT